MVSTSMMGDRLLGRHNFAASMILPAFVSGIFRVRFAVFILGALVAGIGWIGIYVGLSYFLGAEIAARIGQAGTRLLLGIIVIVVVDSAFGSHTRTGAPRISSVR